MITQSNLSKPGTLVRSRGREWLVLPESTDEVLMVRPLGGLDEEIVGILPSVEPVESATFPFPSRQDVGDFTLGRLLREAARLSTRAAAGPFRSFARIAVEPRPYQLVPLMMALRLDPIRLLIADDVGIGKTIEAGLIAREMLDRGEIHRLVVLCPPALAEQWQKELEEKFHIEAELVLSSTIQRLERDLPIGVSVFDRHRFVVVSTDFIKSDRRAADFELKCPEFVIVDEAHGCTVAGGVGRGRQQRFDLVRKIAQKPDRHVVLVTATPHSGNELAFRSLLGLLNEEFFDLPTDIGKEERESVRRKLARYLVQRRRADIRHYLETDTSFPTRLDKEETYAFSPEYRQLFDDIFRFAHEFVSDKGTGERHRRVRYWSALALLRCVSSSPAAAAATLRSRAAADEASPGEVDDVGRRTVLDQDDVDDVATLDFSPGSDSNEDSDNVRRKLLAFARRAENLDVGLDNKLKGMAKEVKALIKDGFQPIVFCRFIDTADYVAKHLRGLLPAGVRVESVTGLLPPAEREARIAALVEGNDEYVLVCTDCLSEGVNLQEHFNAVFHYDLCWNPTRHEQREGRVDRFGQEKPQVRVITYYGKDNPIDGVILDVLIRKHKSIKSELGVTVAVPGTSEQIAETLFEGALFREATASNPAQLTFDFFNEIEPRKAAFHAEWENAREKEKASRSRFAQHSLDKDTVAAELRSVRESIGRNEDVARFFRTLLQIAKVPVEDCGQSVKVHLSDETPRALRQALGREEPFTGRFDLPLQKEEIYLGRTSPIIEGLAGWALDEALDPITRNDNRVASRCGAMSTSAVASRTVILLARFRYHLHVAGTVGETILCEETVPLACRGPVSNIEWLSAEESETLLAATPERNLIATAIEQQIDLLFDALGSIQQALEPVAQKRAVAQLEAHERVREASRTKGRVTVEPVLPVDILGAYVLLPRLP
ncbi:MAG TPA: helicase-related protein [Syntrophorhabdaceae bacterium]|nr:helicase-related protein [Syntrophorhabdaceae bacterium]